MSVADTLIIVGLGNPGPKHAGDRHNVGFWFADQLAAQIGERFTDDSRLKAQACRGLLAGRPVRIFKPQTFMNRSGESVRAALDYYRLPLGSLVVVYDEIDLPVGTVRLKRGGGHGGHNGMRDILSHCGPDFLRLRIGIGHPGHKDAVTGYVLGEPSRTERALILDAIDAGLEALDVLVSAGVEKAMQQLHTVASPGNGADFGPAG
jgi:PTH1 family peptidyl-tRNA hydrolase